MLMSEKRESNSAQVLTMKSGVRMMMTCLKIVTMVRITDYSLTHYQWVNLQRK